MPPTPLAIPSTTAITATQYYLNGSTILTQITGDDRFDFFYDENGLLLGFSYNGAKYYYIRNLQSDIIGILDNSGNQVVSYMYDSWGKLLSIDGSAKDTIGVQNPFRYRGYYYDTETGFYYLNSRYYDPAVGRYINADSMLAGPKSDESILGSNMFAYCLNNPVNMIDESGNWPKWLTAVVAVTVAVVAVVAVAAVVVASGGSAVPVLVGAAVGAAVSATANAVTQKVTTGKIDVADVFIAAAGGGITGAVGGTGINAVGRVATGVLTSVHQTAVSGIAHQEEKKPIEYVINATMGGMSGSVGNVTPNVGTPIAFQIKTSLYDAVDEYVGGIYDEYQNNLINDALILIFGDDSK